MNLALTVLGWFFIAYSVAINLSFVALTVLAMAALGLGVDVRVVARAGGRVAVAVTLSLAVLGAISLAVMVAGAVGFVTHAPSPDRMARTAANSRSL